MKKLDPIKFNDPKFVGKDYGQKPFQESFFTLLPLILLPIIAAIMIYCFL